MDAQTKEFLERVLDNLVQMRENALRHSIEIESLKERVRKLEEKEAE